MNWDLNYLVQSGIMAVCIAVFLPLFVRINGAVPKKVSKYFYILTAILIADGIFSYFDHVYGLVPDNRYELMRITLSVAGYILRPLMLYVVLLLMKRDDVVRHRRLLAIPVIVTFVFAFSAYFTSAVFYIDSKNALHTGPGIFVLYGVLAVYYVLIIATSLKKRDKNVLESQVVILIIALLFFDGVLSIVCPAIDVHEQIKAIAVAMYFMYFICISHLDKVDELHEEITGTKARISRNMLEQAVETLAYTIDSKDKYSRGHSFRVAKYAKQLAALAGKSDEECRDIYLAGLVHDIGKIFISSKILNKDGAFTPEEYEAMKAHAPKGARILKKMHDYPFLADAAVHHHERYDGTGYPDGLKGDEIPEYARIIAVADAYDAMTSNRSYRLMLDQADVKQEIWKGYGTQFDPFYAKMMLSLIDSDLDYEMREKGDSEIDMLFDDERSEITWGVRVPEEIKAESQVMQETNVFMLGRFAALVNNWSTPTKSARVTEQGCSISFHAMSDEGSKYLWYTPGTVIYASGSGNIDDEDYDELGVFIGHGYSWRSGSAIGEKAVLTKKNAFKDWDQWILQNRNGMDYTFSAHRDGDKVIITLENELLLVEATLELPENFDKNIYMTVTGERCSITDVKFSE